MCATSLTRSLQPARRWCARSPAASAAPISTCSSTARRCRSSARSWQSTRRRSPCCRCGWIPHVDVVMGHEFCAEVLDVGPDCSNAEGGRCRRLDARCVRSRGPPRVGYSNQFPGGYGELMLLSDLVAMKVPNGLEPSTRRAHRAARGRHPRGREVEHRSGRRRGRARVRPGRPRGDRRAAARRGIEPIVASDFSPARRALAAKMGAHEVVDPAVERPMDAWRRVDGATPLVIFEAVGVPGMIDQAMVMAPRGRAHPGRRRVHGARPHPPDGRHRARAQHPVRAWATTRPSSPARSARSPRATRRYPEIVTGTVGVDGVPQAFVDLGNPEAHAKILVEP